MAYPFHCQSRIALTVGVACFVTFGIVQAQSFRRLRDVGPLVYPAGLETTTEQGWPGLFLTCREFDDRVLPNSRTVAYEISFGILLLNALTWLLMVLPTTYATWRVTTQNFRFSIRWMFAHVTTLSLALGWWRMKYLSLFDGPLSDFMDLTTAHVILCDLSSNPFIRLLSFSVLCQAGIIAGLAGLITSGVSCVLRLLPHSRSIHFRRNEQIAEQSHATEPAAELVSTSKSLPPAR
jgi:hypothetical protein